LPLFHEKIGPLWTNRNAETEAPVYELFKLDGTKFQYLHGAGNPTRISPDAWIHAQYGLDRPGNGEIQMDLQADYHTNIESYDAWRALLLEHQPPTLVVWGKGDPLFGVQNVDLLKRDMQDIEAHVLNSGHFALEEYSNFIAERINAFFADRAD
jgi:pimeloyl-ACP methyl ester carboxylesterase